MFVLGGLMSVRITVCVEERVRREGGGGESVWEWGAVVVAGGG